jgi:hypothetical protein
MFYDNMDALLTSTTIWGHPSWPAEDQAVATQALRVAHQRLDKVSMVLFMIHEEMKLLTKVSMLFMSHSELLIINQNSKNSSPIL